MQDTRRLGWVRHGRTDWNALGKIQGQTDIPLNEEGILQARSLARRLAQEPWQWEAVIASPLSRAMDTARIVADTLAIPLLPPDERLKERSFGEIEGTTEEERLERWGAQWRQTYTGQESDESVKERGFAFINDWLSREEPRRLLVVTHGSFLTQMLHAQCSGLDRSYIGNLSYSVAEYRENRWHSLLHNCMAHLK